MLFGCRSLTSAATTAATAVDQGRKRIVIYWFRLGDLRLLDNQALTRACLLAKGTKSEPIDGALLPIFCFDDQIFGARAVSAWGNLKCGPKRAQFIIESVTDLRQSLHTHLQTPLLVASGEPARMVDQILTQLKSYNQNETTKAYTDVQIVCQDETAPQEREAVSSVSSILRRHITNGDLDAESNVTAVWGSFLHAGKSMPYPNTRAGMPDLFSRFKADVQKKYKLPQAVLPIPQSIPIRLPPNILDSSMATYMPTLRDLSYTPDQMAHAERRETARGALDFLGGETAALARVKNYIARQCALQDFCDTRNGLIGASYSSKLSPWLAHGCVSPRTVALEAKHYVSTRRQPKGTYIYTVCLVQRDFCRYYAAKHGKRIFYRHGPQLQKRLARNKTKLVSTPLETETATRLFDAWTTGQTGYPFIDACMRELHATGYLSMRGRLNVASFLIFDLDLDWRRGADWFQSQLLDYDVSLNWVVSSQYRNCRYVIRSLTSHLFCCLL
jgi:deoxyribodipyrimidine photo-lyase